ncbi:MAG: hypothetical protein ACREN8_03210 [Candidatus Dormibacteraceae bacterium]
MRSYFHQDHAAQAREELGALLDRVASRSTLSDDQAMSMAYEAVQEVRVKTA